MACQRWKKYAVFENDAIRGVTMMPVREPESVAERCEADSFKCDMQQDAAIPAKVWFWC